MNLMQVHVAKLRKMLLRAARKTNSNVSDVTVSLYTNKQKTTISVHIWVKDTALTEDHAFGIYNYDKSPKQLRQELVQKVREHFSS